MVWQHISNLQWVQSNHNMLLWIEFVEMAKQSYFQSPYIGASFDLLKAVAEQYEFLYKVTQNMQWKRSDLLKMIDNYEYYLELSKRTSNILVPDIKAGNWCVIP